MVEPRRYNRLWERHLDRLVFYAAALLGDRAAAEDAVQSVFTRILAGGLLPAEDTEVAYLFTAVRNTASNELRSRRRAERAFESLFTNPAPDPLESAERAEFGRQVESALSKLPEEEREAVVLKVWGELSLAQAAEVLGVTEKAFEHRYYRGLSALKDLLGVHDEV